MIAGIYELDWRDIRALRLWDAYAVHRAVYDLFPDVRDQQQKQSSVSCGMLYVNQGGDASRRSILFLSDRPPRMPKHGRIATKVIPETFLEHDVYAFKTVVNPTRRIAKKLRAIDDAHVIEWFQTRSWGFETISCQLIRSQWLRFAKDGHDVSLKTSLIQGVLRVAARERYKESFVKGIGRGRAFGCGLLQIVPV